MVNFLTAGMDAGAGMGSTMLMLVIMIGVFYFMLIRPENKKKKAVEEIGEQLFIDTDDSPLLEG